MRDLDRLVIAACDRLMCAENWHKVALQKKSFWERSRMTDRTPKPIVNHCEIGVGDASHSFVFVQSALA
jgi:hypothetical protein